MRAAALLLMLALLTPVAAAHLDYSHETIQAFKENRVISASLTNGVGRFDFNLGSDPLRHLIRHTISPLRGEITTEYREDASAPSEAWRVRYEFARIVEYRDVNEDVRFDPGVDVPVRSWKLVNYQWKATGPLRAQVAERQAQHAFWTGNHTDAPTLRIDAVATGTPFLDEGARVSAQDVIYYIDIDKLPPRSHGNLISLEWIVRTPPGATVRELVAPANVTVSVLVEAPRRLAFLQWGGEALVDGDEQFVTSTLTPLPGEANAHILRIHVPATERAVRLVVVSGVEHWISESRTPAPTPVLVAAALAVAAIASAAVTSRRK